VPRHSLEDLVRELTALLARLPVVIPDDLSSRKRLALRLSVLAAAQTARHFAQRLDPVSHPEAVFDPADPNQMGRFIADALLARERFPLEDLRRFYGSGVYAIYYDGDFPAYQPLRSTDTPIYVGKVDPAVPMAATPVEQGRKLWDRLIRDHARSISRVENLSLDAFSCRYLVVVSAWQMTAETHLINRFRPVWNEPICIGFGKHGDKAETRANTRSAWDELHPGRPWAGHGNKPNARPPERIMLDIAEHFTKFPPG
jgi:hypothetical protein